MPVKHQSLVFFFILIANVLAMTQCRSRKRSEKVGAESLKVLITVQGIDDQYLSDPDLVYSMSCHGEWVEGTRQDAPKNEVEFFIKGAAVGDLCQLRVSTKSPSDDMEFVEEPNVLYGTDKNIQLTTRAKGQLWAEALVAKTFNFKQVEASLTVPVKFEDDIPDNAGELVGSFECKDPAFDAIAVGLEKDNSGQAKFVFVKGVRAGTYKCDDFFVQKNFTVVYSGRFDDVLMIERAKSQKTKEVKLEPVIVTSISGVTVITKPGEPCKDDEEYFDVSKRKCVSKK